MKMFDNIAVMRINTAVYLMYLIVIINGLYLLIVNTAQVHIVAIDSDNMDWKNLNFQEQKK